MKQQLFETLINGTQDLIIQQKINGIKNPNPSNPLSLSFPSLPTPSSISSLPQALSTIFQTLLYKLPQPRKLPSSSLQIHFKLMSNEKRRLLAEEIWQLQWSSRISDKKIWEEEETGAEIITFVKRVVEMTAAVSNWKWFLENQGAKGSNSNQNSYGNCYISYQISYGKGMGVKERTEINMGRIECETDLGDKKVMCRVHYSILSSSENVLAEQKQEKQKFHSRFSKKQSVDTLVTCYSEGFSGSPLSRKISIYSYYDADNDVTFLSNDQFSFENNNQEQSSPTFTLTKALQKQVEQEERQEEQEEYEMILVEEDEKVYQFKEGLRRLALEGMMCCTEDMF